MNPLRPLTSAPRFGYGIELRFPKAQREANLARFRDEIGFGVENNLGPDAFTYYISDGNVRIATGEGVNRDRDSPILYRLWDFMKGLGVTEHELTQGGRLRQLNRETEDGQWERRTNAANGESVVVQSYNLEYNIGLDGQLLTYQHSRRNHRHHHHRADEREHYDAFPIARDGNF